MKTRSFIGLIFLITALVVVASPDVLKQAAKGVEVGATRLGVPKAATPADPSVLMGPTDGENFDAKAGTVDAAERALIIKGYDVGDPDLRDRFQAGERALTERGRLVAGQGRLLLPGQVDRASLFLPPMSTKDGVLLDIDGCPLFSPTDDVALMMQDKEIAARYAERVASADSAQLCRTIFDARVAAAIDPQPSPASQGTVRAAQRDVALTDRTGALGLVTLTSFVDALESFYGTTAYGDAVYAALDARAGTTTQGGAAAGASASSMGASTSSPAAPAGTASSTTP